MDGFQEDFGGYEFLITLLFQKEGSVMRRRTITEFLPIDEK